MLINKHHLTYCTNIHSEKSWSDLFEGLSANILEVKRTVSPDANFGIGLRLSDNSSRELLEGKNLMMFKEWLEQNGLYVFTMNGFPYGVFHNKKVKDDVHKPDWTTQERVEYTKRLCRILSVILPKGMDGGISTSPISYKPWHYEEKNIQDIYKTGAIHVAMVVEEMLNIKRDSGKVLHLDIEPEPDGLLENANEVIQFFQKYLIPFGVEYLVKHAKVTAAVAEEAIRTHIRLCYDICHFAVGYENQKEAIEKFEKAGIKIGKIQISSALKATFTGDEKYSKDLYGEFDLLNDPTYLHQVIERDANNSITQFRDLPEALKSINHSQAKEWRVHFHVPLFIESYGKLKSTQDDVIEVLQLVKEKNITSHLEVETYTWEVLPDELKINIKDSISRELEWVMNKIEESVASK